MNWQAQAAVWPNADASRFVTVPPHRWHVQRMGQGPGLLLLHGAGASTHSWRDMLPDLARDFEVMAIDLPGQGFTRLGNRDRCGPEAMSADIARLLAAESFAPVAVVGHSAGAALAFRLALDLDPPPRAIIAINGALNPYRGPAGPLFQGLARLLALNPLTALAFSRIAPARVAALIGQTGSRIDGRGLDLYRHLIADRGHVDATLRMMSQWDLTRLLDALPKVAQPCLFLVGDEDNAVPPRVSINAAARVREGEVVHFPGLGHLMHEEAPAETTAAIRRFLSRRIGDVA